MTLDIIIRCSKRLQGSDIQLQEQKKADKLTEEIAASIPYHLTDDLQVYVQELQTGSGIMIPGRPVGGLLLLHPLYVAARLSIVSPQLRDYMSGCLAWIGKNMGIGQATLLSNASVLRAAGPEGTNRMSSLQILLRFSISPRGIFSYGQACSSSQSRNAYFRMHGLFCKIFPNFDCEASLSSTVNT